MITSYSTRSPSQTLNNLSFDFIMTHWSNFPATSEMTEFEVVVVQNERARWERTHKGKDEVIMTNDSQDIDDETMVLNILSKHGTEPVPIPITPMHPTPTPPLEQTFQLQAEMELSSITSTSDECIVEDEVNLDNIATKKDLMTDSGSSDSYKSVPSSNSSPKLAIILQELQEMQRKKKKPRLFTMNRVFRDNTTKFMEDINEMNVNNTKRTILISAIRPRFQCQIHNEFFVCHICHTKPRQIKIVEKLWKIASEKNDDKLGNELPFAYSLRGIIDHLTNFHSFTHEDKSRDMILAVANYIDMVNKDIEEDSSTMFSSRMFKGMFKIKSIPKASSTSCLETRWKSNQTELTTKLAHTYDFKKNNHTTFCNGHPKLKLNPTHDIAYVLDLADTVYCSCNAITVKFGTIDFKEMSAAKMIFDHTLNILQEDTFFNVEKKSNCQSHATMLCNYKFIQSIPKFSKRTYKPVKPLTRQDAREKAAEEKNKEESAKDNINKDEKVKSEKQKYDKSKMASCKTLTPVEQRLRPEGNSPPSTYLEQLEDGQQHVSSAPLQGQLVENNRAGNSMKTTMGHAMATAASLLKRPARKSDYV